MTSDPFVIGFLLAAGMCAAIAVAGAIGGVAYVAGRRAVAWWQARAEAIATERFTAELDRLEEAEGVEEAERVLRGTYA